VLLISTSKHCHLTKKGGLLNYFESFVLHLLRFFIIFATQRQISIGDEKQHTPIYGAMQETAGAVS
jgi:hypothetical protein